MAEGLTTEQVLAESEHLPTGWLHRCGTELLGAQVHHSVHDSPIPLTGSGQVQVQTVPYCPLCHVKPADHGAPIRPGDEAWPVVRVTPKVPSS